MRAKDSGKTMEAMAIDRDKKASENKGEGAAMAVNEKAAKQAEQNDRSNLDRVVFVRNGDVVKMVKVETGVQDISHLEIKSGLKEGDEVVSGSFSVITRTLKDGSKVQLEKGKKKEEKK